LLVAANWQLNREKKIEEEPIIDGGILPELPPEIIKEETPEPIQVNINDNVPIKEEMVVNTRPEEHPVEHITVGYQPAEVSDDELNITVDESKDWEPNLYDRLERRDETLPQKTQSFLNKAREVFSSIGVTSIEREVQDLQDKKPK
jgi:hypothetical protein